MRNERIVLEALPELLRNIPEQQGVSETEMASIGRGGSEAEDDLVHEVNNRFGISLEDLRCGARVEEASWSARSSR